MKKIIVTALLSISFLLLQPFGIHGTEEPTNQIFHRYLHELNLELYEDPSIPVPSWHALEQYRESKITAQNACASFSRGTWLHDYFRTLVIGYGAIIKIIERELNR